MQTSQRSFGTKPTPEEVMGVASEPYIVRAPQNLEVEEYEKRLSLHSTIHASSHAGRSCPFCGSDRYVQSTYGSGDSRHPCVHGGVKECFKCGYKEESSGDWFALKD